MDRFRKDCLIVFSPAVEHIDIALNHRYRRAQFMGSITAFFAIQDNGIGMAQQDVEHVFDRFFRADAVRHDTIKAGIFEDLYIDFSKLDIEIK